MLIYFTTLFLVVAAIYFSQRARNKIVHVLFNGVAILFLVLISGLRNSSVGTDAGSYARYYERIVDLTDAFSVGLEPGYFFLCWLGKQVSSNYISIFLTVAIIITLCFFYGIKKLSVNPTFSIFFLLSSGIFYFHFNGMRQGIAIAILFISMIFVYERRIWLFLIFVAIASLFHYTALIALPIYLVPKKNNLKHIILLFVMVVILIVLYRPILPILGEIEKFNSRYIQYFEPSYEGRGLIYSSFIVCLSIFFLFLKKYIKQYRYFYSFLLNIFLIGVAIILISIAMKSSGSGIMRLSSYFRPAEVLLWPILFANLQSKKIRDLFIYGIMILYLTYHALTLQAFGNMVPYKLNPIVLNKFSILF